MTTRLSETAGSRSFFARILPSRQIHLSLLALGTLVLASAGVMQAQQPPAQQQNGTQHAAPAQSAATSPASATSSAGKPTATQAPATPPNLLDQPAEPATVEDRAGSLSVRANNASLAQILHQVARDTGMQLDGLAGDERVFGTFGPGNPRDVLVSLLNGTSYNVMMVGDLASGAPRQLLLTRKSSSALASANAPQPQAKPSDNPDDSEDAPPDQDAPQPQPDQSQDLQNQQPEEPPPGSPDMPRTPQQMLEQLQQLHQSDQPPEQSPEQSPEPPPQ
ncbi:MAG: hypothetical protein ACR2JE_14575 [Acidobacteriaceae bacterium]